LKIDAARYSHVPILNNWELPELFEAIRESREFKENKDLTKIPIKALKISSYETFRFHHNFLTSFFNLRVLKLIDI
jgi:hypothetical protein